MKYLIIVMLFVFGVSMYGAYIRAHDSSILLNHNQYLVVIGATWCPWCRTEDLTLRTHVYRLPILKFDVDKDQESIHKMGINAYGVPILAIWDGYKVTKVHYGYMTDLEIRKMLQ